MPKCASTSIEVAIKPHCNINYAGHPILKHMDARTFNKWVLPPCEQANPHIESICLMRDPLDWIESWYRYRTRDGLIRHKNYTGDISYNEFITRYIAGETGIDNQFNFQIGIDRIIPLTRIDLFSKFISKKIGTKIVIPKLNVSPGKRTYLDPILKKNLIKHLSKDINLYKSIENL